MAEEVADKNRIRFDYIKSNLFRVVHADGVMGGPTPKGLLFLSFFNERQPIPQQTVHQIVTDAGGSAKVGNEDLSQRVSRHAIIRETEVGVLLDLMAAKRLHEWLGQHIGRMVEAGIPDAEA